MTHVGDPCGLYDEFFNKPCCRYRPLNWLHGNPETMNALANIKTSYFALNLKIPIPGSLVTLVFESAVDSGLNTVCII